jgi:hypothetical protein
MDPCSPAINARPCRVHRAKRYPRERCQDRRIRRPNRLDIDHFLPVPSSPVRFRRIRRRVMHARTFHPVHPMHARTALDDLSRLLAASFRHGIERVRFQPIVGFIDDLSDTGRRTVGTINLVMALEFARPCEK